MYYSNCAQINFTVFFAINKLKKVHAHVYVHFIKYPLIFIRYTTCSYSTVNETPITVKCTPFIMHNICKINKVFLKKVKHDAMKKKMTKPRMKNV